MVNVFHNEETKQVNFLDNRYYTNDEVNFFPSVTTILEVYPKGFGFHQWLKDVGNAAAEIADRAGRIGTKIHETTELLNKGIEIKWADDFGNAQYSKEEWEMLMRFCEFWKVCNPDLIANEQGFCSPKLRFGGTIDRVVKINGKTWLIDIKTSNYLHTSHELQLAAYATMWNEFNPHCPIDETAIMWVKSSTRTNKVDVEKMIYQGVGWQLNRFDRNYKESFKIFQYTQAIWEEEHPTYKPANLIYPDTLKL